MPNITWKENDRKGASYMGRNGTGKCLGVEAFVSQYFTTLQPINSKGNLGTCVIQVPNTHINDLCRPLQADLLDVVLTQLKDQLPRLMGIDPRLDNLVAKKLQE